MGPRASTQTEAAQEVTPITFAFSHGWAVVDPDDQTVFTTMEVRRWLVFEQRDAAKAYSKAIPGTIVIEVSLVPYTWFEHLEAAGVAKNLRIEKLP